MNARIPVGQLDGMPFKLRLPTPLDLARKMVLCWRGCLIYKVNLSGAYRLLRSCPRDWPLLMINWQGRPYVDVAVPFGLRHGASAYQRTTEAVVKVARAEAGTDASPYIDDTVGAAVEDEAQRHPVEQHGQAGTRGSPSKCVDRGNVQFFDHDNGHRHG